MNSRTCFILMPFNKAENLEKVDLDYIYFHILKKIIEEYKPDGEPYFQIVERFDNRVGSIINGIVNNLHTADLVIADLTGLNPNVMYELGVRHSLKRGTIIITQNLEKLPSDLRDYLTVGYKFSQKTTEQVSNYEELKQDLYRNIDEIFSTSRYDSPVLSYLQLKQRFRDEDEISKLKDNLVIVDAMVYEVTEIAQFLSNFLFNAYQKSEEEWFFQMFNFKLNNLSISLNELNLPYRTKEIYQRLINAKSIISEMVRTFGVNEYFGSLNNIEGLQGEPFGPRGLASSVNKDYPNFFALFKTNKIEYVNIFDFFKENGVWDNEFLKYLIKYLEDRSSELGLGRSEIEKLIASK